MDRVIIAVDHADARSTTGLTQSELRRLPVVTPRGMSGARGWTADAVTITAAAFAHPMLPDMLAEVAPCLH